MSARPWFPIAILLAGCGAPAPITVSSTPPPPKSGIGATISYGPDPRQKLEVFPVESKGPLVVFVHGGAWQGGTKDEYHAVMTALQGRDIASATVDYRLSPQVQHPAHAEDVAHALAWLAANAEKQGYDPARIFVVGHSAGAHIAATIATDPKLLALAKPAGFIGLEGIYDVPNLAQRWPAYPDWFLNKAFGNSKGWPAASPTRAKVVSKARWLLVHSKGDELVDPGQTADFAKHLKDAGVKVLTLAPERKTHDGVIGALAAPKDEVTEAIVKFIQAKP